MKNVKYKICYWYHEYQDMSASVPTCDYYRQYGECPCEPECEHFITKKEVDDIVRNMSKIGQMSDLISREDAINQAQDGVVVKTQDTSIHLCKTRVVTVDRINELPSAEAEWIPCSERMPSELEAVNVTWVNHNPPVYYQYTKDVPNADTAVYYRGAWYWWDATVIDLLGEYGGAYIHGIEPIDKDVEVTAWMPLPIPYKGGDDK